MTTPPRNLTLRIEEREESIQGSLGDEAGASREFSGWLGLARALELTLAQRPGSPDGVVLLHHPEAGGQLDPVE